MRKTECFGDLKEGINFEWPLADDIRNMPKNILIKINDISYKKSTTSSKRFAAFQLRFTNGIKKEFTSTTERYEKNY